MGELLPFLCSLLVLGVAARHGFATLGATDRAAGRFAAAWADEYAVRLCGRVTAADSNLAAAARYLALRLPARAEAINNASLELRRELSSTYSQVPPPGAAGRCRTNGPARLAASLHLEHHPGQPDPWPNWVTHFEREEAPDANL